jgi:hypothetical protein
MLHDGAEIALLDVHESAQFGESLHRKCYGKKPQRAGLQAATARTGIISQSTSCAPGALA